jgi:hypothetical protein
VDIFVPDIFRLTEINIGEAGTGQQFFHKSLADVYFLDKA